MTEQKDVYSRVTYVTTKTDNYKQMSFYELLQSYNWAETYDDIYSKNKNDVARVFEKDRLDIEDFKTLVSPAASPFLEEMAQQSRSKTLHRFGKNIQLYVPLYLSNECTNFCVYCGFNHNNTVERLTLNSTQIMEEADAIKKMGFEHVLLVTGEHPSRVGYNYLKDAIQLLKKKFKLISIEVAPMETEEYKNLVETGLNSVYIYQETYHQERYGIYHPKGKKADFKYRLETPERLGKAGVYKTGLGCLLGLEDWRTDSFFTALHLDYLRRNYWRTKYSIAFPRLRPHAGSFKPNSIISDRELVQLICAYRLFDENVELSLSTRESAEFRDHLVHMGITTMSAGSSTEPGGYAGKTQSLEQFAVDDSRSPREVMSQIKAAGYEAVWKDWDTYLQ